MRSIAAICIFLWFCTSSVGQVSDLENQLFNLELQSAELRERVGEGHPKVEQIQKQIANLKDMLANAKEDALSNADQGERSSRSSAERQKKLNNLQLELTDLRTRYGSNHPAVRAVENRLELAQKLEADLSASEEVSKQLEQQNELREQIQRLEIKRNELTRTYGPEHKNIQELNAQLQALEEELAVRTGENNTKSIVAPDVALDAVVAETSIEESIPSLRKAYANAEEEANECSVRLVNEKDPTTQKLLMKQLAAAVTRAFESRINLQRAQIRAAAQDLMLARERLEKRKELSELIIDKRVRELADRASQNYQNHSNSTKTEPSSGNYFGFDNKAAQEAMIGCEPISAEAFRALSIGNRIWLSPRVERTENGWILYVKKNKPMRQFSDENSDGVIDRWLYYKDGKEFYEDVDVDQDGRADVGRFIAGTKTVELGKPADPTVEIRELIQNAITELKATERRDSKGDGADSTSTLKAQIMELENQRTSLSRQLKAAPEDKEAARAYERVVSDLAFLKSLLVQKESKTQANERTKLLLDSLQLKLQEFESAAKTDLPPLGLMKNKSQSNAKFSARFENAPWQSVLKWLAHSEDLALQAEEFPTGTVSLNLKEPRTADEFMQILKEMLSRSGFTLERKPGRIELIPLGAN